MSVMDMNSRMAMAEKLSVQQLQQAIQSGSLPAYIGIPLIEQKNKEKSQMAAAQQGQQKPPSVASQILQQAEQQEQQEQGIDQLPSNLPVMEGEEMGMAEGGIIAFSAGTPEGVKDPEQDPRIIALRQDPAYLAFAESGGIDGDTSLTAFLQAGNTPTPTRSSQSPLQMRAAQVRESQDRGIDPAIQSAAQQARDAYSPNNASLENRAPGTPMGEVFGTYADKLQRAIQGSESNVPSDLRAYSDRGMFSGMPTGGPDSRPPAAPDSMGDNAGPEYEPGIAAAPGARLVNPNVPGAPRTAPTGTPSAAPSAGPRTAPQGGAPSSGRGALPPTLAAAERSDSSAANQATSMLDKYVAQLEKSGEDVGRQKKEALYMALIQGGLAAAGGMSPNALQNIAQGAMVGAQNYQQAMRDIKKEDRARIEKLINAGLSKEKFAMELRKLGIEDKKADAMINYYNARAGAAGGGGGGKEDRLVRQGYERSGAEYDSLARRVRADMASALKNDSEYTGAKTQLSFVKTLKPADREKLERIVRDKEAPYLSQIRDYSNKSRYFMKQAGMDLSSGGGGKENVDLDQFFK